MATCGSSPGSTRPRSDEVKEHRQVNLSYADPRSQNYVSISGTAQIVRDRQKVQELWSEPLATWFPKGKDDPNIGLIRVHVDQSGILGQSVERHGPRLWLRESQTDRRTADPRRPQEDQPVTCLTAQPTPSLGDGRTPSQLPDDLRLSCRRIAQRLIDHAIPLGQLQQAGELFFSGIGIQIERQPDRPEPDRRIFRHAKRPPEIQIPLRPAPCRRADPRSTPSRRPAASRRRRRPAPPAACRPSRPPSRHRRRQDAIRPRPMPVPDRPCRSRPRPDRPSAFNVMTALSGVSRYRCLIGA